MQDIIRNSKWFYKSKTKSKYTHVIVRKNLWWVNYHLHKERIFYHYIMNLACTGQFISTCIVIVLQCTLSLIDVHADSFFIIIINYKIQSQKLLWNLDLLDFVFFWITYLCFLLFWRFFSRQKSKRSAKKVKNRQERCGTQLI